MCPQWDKNVPKETSQLAPTGPGCWEKGGKLMDITELTVHELQEKLKFLHCKNQTTAQQDRL